MIILRNKTYSHEEEIANIAAAPGSPEYIAMKEPK